MHDVQVGRSWTGGFRMELRLAGLPVSGGCLVGGGRPGRPRWAQTTKLLDHSNRKASKEAPVRPPPASGANLLTSRFDMFGAVPLPETTSPSYSMDALEVQYSSMSRAFDRPPTSTRILRCSLTRDMPCRWLRIILQHIDLNGARFSILPTREQVIFTPPIHLLNTWQTSNRAPSFCWDFPLNGCALPQTSNLSPDLCLNRGHVGIVNS